MSKRIFVWLLATFCLTTVSFAEAAQAKVYRVGVILQGGPYYAVVDGLRDGLKELGLEEGKHFALEIRDTKGDLKVVEQVARNLEREKVNLVYAVTTSVTAVVRRVTADIPIVFCAGADPVSEGLVDSIAKPGGRLTGVHFLSADLTAKRFEVLKEILPKLRRVVTFYNPEIRPPREAAKLGREQGSAWGSSSSSGTSLPSRSFRPVWKRSRPRRRTPSSTCRTGW